MGKIVAFDIDHHPTAISIGLFGGLVVAVPALLSDWQVLAEGPKFWGIASAVLTVAVAIGTVYAIRFIGKKLGG